MQPYTVEELEFINRGATANTKEIEMFDTDEFIDTVQSAKKTMVKTFVQNETIAKSMSPLSAMSIFMWMRRFPAL